MVVLATNVYVEGKARERAIDSLRSLIGNDLDGLDTEWSLGVREDGFPSVTVDGPDAVVARNVLRERWGSITPAFEPGEEYVGTLEAWDETGIVLDAGERIHVPSENLGLGQGTPEQIRTRFGLIQHLPMRFVYDDKPQLADAERDRLYEWTRGNGQGQNREQGRVHVNSATRAEVRATVNRAGHAEDIVTVERLGLLEQGIVCRDGTDPPGILAAIGQYLPSELLCVVP
jgi:hypothetical protein